MMYPTLSLVWWKVIIKEGEKRRLTNFVLLGRQMMHTEYEAIFSFYVDVFTLVAEIIGVVSYEQRPRSGKFSSSHDYLSKTRQDPNNSLSSRTVSLSTDPLFPILLDLSPRRSLDERIHFVSDVSDERHHDQKVESQKCREEGRNLREFENPST